MKANNKMLTRLKKLKIKINKFNKTKNQKIINNKNKKNNKIKIDLNLFLIFCIFILVL